MNIVPRRNTPLTASQALAAVNAAYFDFFRTSPPKRTLELLLALVWVETGRGRSCQNFNVGNITAGSQFSGNAWRPPWFEPGPGASARDVHLHQEMLAGRAPSAFRAYDTLQAGCADFIRILDRSFANVLDVAEDGDPDAFREALAEKYSKDYENPKATETFRQLQQEFRALIGGADLPGDRPFPLLMVFGGVAIAAAAGGLLWLTLRVKPDNEVEAA